MKRTLLLLVLLSFFTLGGFSFANEVEVSVAINNQFVQDDANHYLIDGNIYVIARLMIEALGGEVTWVPETQEIQILYLESTIRMQIGNPVAYINEIEVPLDSAPFIKDGKAYIPLRFVAETFACEVRWFEHSYTVHILKEGYVMPEAFIYQRPYDDADLIWLSRIIQAESPSGSQLKKMAVANVVLNRVKSSRFPNTIYDVIFSPNQFPPTRKESFQTLQASQESVIAAKRALEGNNPVEECLFFNNRPFTSLADSFFKKIEGDYFYK